MTKKTSTELQTPASQAAQELAAGHGGSYSMDPKTGAVTLNQRTQAARAGTKHPDAPKNLPARQAAPSGDQAPAPGDTAG